MEETALSLSKRITSSNGVQNRDLEIYLKGFRTKRDSFHRTKHSKKVEHPFIGSLGFVRQQEKRTWDHLTAAGCVQGVKLREYEGCYFGSAVHEDDLRIAQSSEQLNG